MAEEATLAGKPSDQNSKNDSHPAFLCLPHIEISVVILTALSILCLFIHILLWVTWGIGSEIHIRLVTVIKGMNSNWKAGLEVGPLKFDFEGEDDAVTRKIELVKPLIQAWLAQEKIPPAKEAQGNEKFSPPLKNVDGGEIPMDPSLTKIFKRGKVLSLNTRPEPRKAFLLTLYGYKTIQNQEIVGAAQLAKSLDDTGITYSRVSNLAAPLEAEWLINISGQKKGTRYVLTNAGITEAEKILQEEKGTS